MGDAQMNEISPFLVLVGASSGGIQPIQALLDTFEKHQGTAIIIHQAAEAFSMDPLPGLWSIVKAHDGQSIKGGNIYLLPPHSVASIQDMTIFLAAGSDTADMNGIDSLFSTAAAEAGDKVIGILFPSKGDDGQAGLSAIRDAGGLSIALTDPISKPEELAAEILFHVLSISGEKSENSRDDVMSQIGASLDEICDILQQRKKHDFRHYKSTTIVRRILRRMQVVQISSVSSYIEKLKAQNDEVDALFCELLINVTSFFRDPEAFEFVQTEILTKTLQKADKGKYRIWIAGCSSGEEVYTMAILVQEVLATLHHKPEVQILATDIDEAALKMARKGSYPPGIAQNVSEERLAKYFSKKNGRYEVQKELRELCLFSLHNLLSDPPFSEVDLILCRNVLIYISAHLQRKVIPTFHYSLKPGGYLFLGASESLSNHKELFRSISARHRIAQRKEASVRIPAHFSIPTALNHIQSNKDAGLVHEHDFFVLSQRIVMDEFAPRYVIVNEDGNIMAASSGVSDFFEIGEGNFQNNILRLAKPNLRVSMRSALNEARKEKRQIKHSPIVIGQDEAYARIEIIVRPMPRADAEHELYMIVFRDLGTFGMKYDLDSSHKLITNDSMVMELENELVTLRADLDKTIQDLEASNEELKSSNEELLSMNEELQSTNEELETSKEDVQDAYHDLQRANSDLENLLASTRIATLFLDDQLQIKSFTPAIESVYDLRIQDIGRPITTFSSFSGAMPPYPKPTEIHDHLFLEAEVPLPGDQTYLRRILPYRTHENKREGLVVAFIDVTDLRRSEERLHLALDSARMGTWHLDVRTNTVNVSARASEILGIELRNESVLDAIDRVTYAEDKEEVNRKWQESIANHCPFSHEFRIVRPDGSIRWVHSRGQPSYNSDGTPLALTGVMIDNTEQRISAERLETSELQFRTLAESIPQLAWMADKDGDIFWYNQRWYAYTGMTFEKMRGWGWTAVHHPEHLQNVIKEVEALWLKGEAWEKTYLLRKHTGEYRWFLTKAEPIKDADGKVLKWIGTNTDIHDQQRAREILERKGEEFRLITEAIPHAVWRAEPDGSADYFSQNFHRYIGQSENNLLGWGWLDTIHPQERDRVALAWKRSVERGLPVSLDFRAQGKDGSYRWYQMVSNPFFDEKGQITKYYGTWTDINEQKQGLEELRFQHYLTQTITDNAASCLFMMDKRGHPTFMNPAAEKLTGYTFDEIKDKPLHYSVHYRKPDGSYYPMEECPIDNAQAELKPLKDCEEIFVDKFGRLYPVSYSIAPLERDGEIIGSVLEFRDITAQKKSEDELNDSIKTLETITETGQALSAELDLDRLVQTITNSARILSKAAFGAFFYSVVNEKGEAYTLYNVSGVPIENFSKFPMPRKTEIFAPTFEGDGIVRSDDITKDSRYGKNKPNQGMPEGHLPVRSYLAVPVISSSGKVLGGLFFGHPETGVFTEKEEKLVSGLAAQAAIAIDNAHLYKNVQEAVRARDEFLTIASHELKTPITSLKLQMQILARQIQKGDREAISPENLTSVAQVSIRQTKQLTSLIDDMLDVARIATGRMEFDFAEHDLAEIIKDTFGGFSSQLKEAGVTSTLDSENPLPIRCDSFRIEQVLSNLFSNALKYGKGSPISIRAKRDEDFAIIEVEDKGMGIAAEHLSRIFKRFERAISPKNITGLGLGLYISREIILAHGGDISVHSEIGSGSIFTVKIPLALKLPIPVEMESSRE